jgi:hypothetical protein
MGWGTMRIQAKHAHISTAPDQLSNFFLKLVVHRKYFTYSACAVVCAVACVLCGRNTQLKPTPGQRGGRGVEGARGVGDTPDGGGVERSGERRRAREARVAG